MKWNRKLANWNKSFVKWTPVIITLAMIISFAFALAGNYEPIEHISPKFGVALIFVPYMYTGSCKYKFCYWHKSFIIAIGVVSLLVNVNHDLFIIPYLWYMWGILLVSLLSVLLAVVLFMCYGCYNRIIKNSTARN